MEYNEFLKYLEYIFKTKNINLNSEKINIIREELQKIILYSIYNKTNIGYKMLFLGGTNLRICYNLDRFSEDLDFALDTPNTEISIEKILYDIEKEFLNLGYEINIKISNLNTTVQKVLLKFPYIIGDLGVGMPSQKVTIKFEIDLNPSVGHKKDIHTITSFIGNGIIHNHSIDTTFAGKIGALLLREYVKGRDYYDIYWYFYNFPHVLLNIDFLQNVIIQYNQNNNENIYVPKTISEVLNMILEKIQEETESVSLEKKLDMIYSDLQRFVSWNEENLNLFCNTYIEKVYNLLKKYKDIHSDSGKSVYTL